MEPTTTALATSEKPDLSHVVEAALDAFWDVVVDHYPLAETGDLSPLTTVALDPLQCGPGFEAGGIGTVRMQGHPARTEMQRWPHDDRRCDQHPRLGARQRQD